MSIDLKPFCGTNGGRYTLEIPHVRGGVRYAIDGKIAIAIPAPGEPDSVPTPEQRFPNCDGIIIRPPKDATLLSWPDAPCFLPGQRTCPMCGKGEIADPQRFAHLSPTAMIDGHYWRLVSALPGPVEWYQPRPEKPIYFQFRGGEGALMPVIYPKV